MPSSALVRLAQQHDRKGFPLPGLSTGSVFTWQKTGQDSRRDDVAVVYVLEGE
ncbi:MAG: hypothetical protein R3F37_16580 [Candidatus Competibacteraceae bacterium]